MIRSTRLLAGVAALVAAAVLAPTALAAARTWYVAPSGSDAGCGANSAATPFATIQAAILCAHNGDAIVLAPSSSTPYPGIGAVDKNVTIKAAGGANARNVAVDLGQPTDPNGFSAGLLSVAAGRTVRVQGVGLECLTGVCVGSLVTNNGTLTLTGVLVAGAQHGAAINDVSTGSAPAVLTVTSSTIAHNSNDGLIADSSAAGISATGAPAPVVTVQNSTIADNDASFGSSAGAIYTLGGASGEVTLTGDTIVDNSGVAAGGIEAVGASSAPVLLSNTIVEGNTAAPGPNTGTDCLGTIGDGPGGHNLVGDMTDCHGVTNGLDGDLVEVPNPGLNALADNGGAADTVSLQPQSPAIGAGDVATCKLQAISGKDERGVGRKLTKRGCDIGAYDTAGTGGVAGHTWYVAPGGTTSNCGSNSKLSPFATIQAALACAADGDVVVLAPSGSTPYPGIGAVDRSVTIEAAPGATARSVVVELSNPADSAGFSAGLLSVASSASVRMQNVALRCTATSGHLCLSQSCEVSQCVGSLVTNNGALSLDRVSVSGAVYGPAINDLSTGSVPARLVVTSSTIAHNSVYDLTYEEHAAGINASFRPGAPDPHVTISNSTIEGNIGQSDSGGIYDNAASPTIPSLTLVGDTITGNSGDYGAGGVASPWSPALVSNTVIAGNSTDAPAGNGPDCAGKLVDGPGGHNVIGDGSHCTTLVDGVNGDRVGTAAAPIDPRLAPLAYNGGPTPTNALLADSPLLSAGDPLTCAGWPLFGVDQRGKQRNTASRGACDIGAYDTGG